MTGQPIPGVPYEILLAVGLGAMWAIIIIAGLVQYIDPSDDGGSSS